VASADGEPAPEEQPSALTAIRFEPQGHVLGERHLWRLVRDYVACYNVDRPHMSLDRDSPAGRVVEIPGRGRVVALPRVGGLHHRYSRAA
jgi:hypothetical protein